MIRRAPLRVRAFLAATLTATWSCASAPSPANAGAAPVADRQEAVNRLDLESWEAAGHRLGRGRLVPAHVVREGGAVGLIVDPRGFTGAELRTRDRLGYGSYRARLTTPRVPGSLTAFFLYEDVPEGNDEIDIEIYNDGSRRALLTLWREGRRARHTEIQLPFDPSAGPHEYGIDFQPGWVAFVLEGEVVERWESDLDRPMRVMLSAWWPAWLEPSPAPRRGRVRVEWVRW